MNPYLFGTGKITEVPFKDCRHCISKNNESNSQQKEKKKRNRSSILNNSKIDENFDSKNKKFPLEEKERMVKINTDKSNKSRKNSQSPEAKKVYPFCIEEEEDVKSEARGLKGQNCLSPEKIAYTENLNKNNQNKIRNKEPSNKAPYSNGSNSARLNNPSNKIKNEIQLKGKNYLDQIIPRLNIEQKCEKCDTQKEDNDSLNQNEYLSSKEDDLKKELQLQDSISKNSRAYRNGDTKKDHKDLPTVKNNINLGTRESHIIDNTLKDSDLNISLSEPNVKFHKLQNPMESNSESEEEEKNIIEEEKIKGNSTDKIDKNQNYYINNAVNNLKNPNEIFDEGIPSIDNERNLNIQANDSTPPINLNTLTNSIFLNSELECKKNSTINLGNCNKDLSEAASIEEVKKEENKSHIKKSFIQQNPNNMNDDRIKYSQFVQEYHNNSALNVYMFLNLISRFNLISQHLGLKINQCGDPIMDFSLSQLLNGITNPSYSINKERKNINLENKIMEISKGIIKNNQNFTDKIKMTIKQEVVKEIKTHITNLNTKNDEEIQKQIKESEANQAKIMEKSISSKGFVKMKFFTEEQNKIQNKIDLNLENINLFKNKINTIISDNSRLYNKSIEQIKSEMADNKNKQTLINNNFNEEFQKIQEELKKFKKDSSEEKDVIVNIINKHVNLSKQKEETLEMMNEDFQSPMADLKSGYRTVNDKLNEDKGKIDLIINIQKEDHEKFLNIITKTESDFNSNLKLFYQQFKEMADVVGVSFENNLFMIQDIESSKMGKLCSKHTKEVSLSLSTSKINQNQEKPQDSHFVNLISKIETMEELMQQYQEAQKEISKQLENLVKESKEKLSIVDFQNQLVNYSIKSDVELKMQDLNKMIVLFNNSIDKFTTKIANFQKNFCENCNSIIIDAEGSCCKHDDCSRMICRKCSDFCFCCRKLFCKKKESLKCSKCQRNVCPNCKKMEGKFEKCEKCNNLFCSKCLKTNWPKLICKACFLVNLPESLEKLNKILSSEINIQEIPYWNFSLIQNMSRDDLKNVIHILECSMEVLSINLSVLNPLKDINIFKDFINSILDHTSLTNLAIEYSDQISIKEIFDYLNEKITGLTFLEEFSISGKNIKDFKNLVKFNNNSPLQENFHFHFISKPLPTSPFPFSFIRFTKRRAL